MSERGVPAGRALDASLKFVLGGKTAKALSDGFGMATVGELLRHYPRRYAHRGELTALREVPEGEEVTIVAEVVSATSRRMQARRGSILEVVITDGSGRLTLTFFNQPWRDKELMPGARGIFSGRVGLYKGVPQLAHPDYELFPAAQTLAEEEARRWAAQPIPIYPAVSAMPSWRIAAAIGLVLDTLPQELPDPVPPELAGRRGLLPYRRAIELVHRPGDDEQARAARRTLRYHEALVLQTALLQRRAQSRERPARARPRRPGGLLERFDAATPFALTAGQRAAGEEIAADLAGRGGEHTAPMQRLLQGEVGSGKTLVALRAMLQVADSGGQSALLAPTEVLAAQHLRSIVAALGPDLAAEMAPTLVTGQLPAAERRRALLAAASGTARIVVGTHALLSETTQFAELGLLVVDEQHRFGVRQREALRGRGELPVHLLVLTATPIPRTVAMTVFGDLDVSVLSELPAGRAGVQTFVAPLAERPSWRPRLWERAAEEIAQGRQVFVVCPAIDASSPEDEPEDGPAQPEPQESGRGPGRRGEDQLPGGAERGEAAARPPVSVEATLQELASAAPLASARVAALHGRMSSEQKDAAMAGMAAGRIDLLVATTVIEVGVDVPNASMMVVLDADRFGISQLHQLRGRIGRGAHPGVCILVTEAEAGTPARERLDAVAATGDGFLLAQEDLRLRGEGDVLGGLQSGARSSLRLLRVARDGELIALAREDAQALLAADPSLAQHGQLRAAVDAALSDSERAFLGLS